MTDRATLVHEQFDDLAQQRRASTFGMWVFLGTELMFFGGVFLAYTIYRLIHHDAFVEAARHLDTTIGSINTFVLLTSSFFCSVAVSMFESRKRAPTLVLLGLTLLFGIVFLVAKGFEYQEDWRHGLVPGPAFAYSGPEREQAELFFVLYFIATGLHAVHLFVGIVLITVLMVLVMLSWFRPRREVAVGTFGLYWHFVDLIWIFIFPLFYLLGGT
jgi:cytochrome c oxidase subunit III